MHDTRLVKNNFDKVASAFVMTTLQTGDERQSNEPNSLFPIALESELRLPLIRSMFTGYFNGFSVEIRSAEEMAMLHQMGCFGKGSRSRSAPQLLRGEPGAEIMRKRQFSKRAFWYKKFSKKVFTESDDFLRDIDKLLKNIIADKKSQAQKDVIDLVSSDEEVMDVTEQDERESPISISVHKEDDDIVVIVPNSDSEGEDYFENLKPKCCINKTTIQEKLILSLQEAFFLMYGLGCLQITDHNQKLLNIQQSWQLFIEVDKKFLSNYIVYHYFRSKGYVVKSGLKFGGDYLLYREGPGIAHADYIVIIKSEGLQLHSWTEMLGQVRMAATTSKEVIIAEVVRNKEQDTIQEMPEGLTSYSVREMRLSRKLPIEINDVIE